MISRQAKQAELLPLQALWERVFGDGPELTGAFWDRFPPEKHTRVIDRDGVEMKDRRASLMPGIASPPGIHPAPGKEARPFEIRLVHPRPYDGEIGIPLLCLAADHIIGDAAAEGACLDSLIPGQLGKGLRWHSY